MKSQLKKIKEQMVFDNYIKAFLTYKAFYRAMRKEKLKEGITGFVEKEVRYLGMRQNLDEHTIKQGIEMAQKYLN